MEFQTLIPPSSYSNCLYGSFSDIRVVEIVAVAGNGTWLHLLRPTDAGTIQLIHAEPVHGIIRDIQVLQPRPKSKSLAGSDTLVEVPDRLLISSDSGQIVILQFSNVPGQLKWEKVLQHPFGRSGCRRTVPGQYIAVDPLGTTFMISAIEKQKLVYILNYDFSTGELSLNSPLLAHRDKTIVEKICALDVGQGNPVYACIEVPFDGADRQPCSPAKKYLTYYEVDFATNYVIRLSSIQIPLSSHYVLPLPGRSRLLDETNNANYRSNLVGPGGCLVFSHDMVTYHHPLHGKKNTLFSLSKSQKISAPSQPLFAIMPARSSDTQNDERYRIHITHATVRPLTRSYWRGMMESNEYLDDLTYSWYVLAQSSLGDIYKITFHITPDPDKPDNHDNPTKKSKTGKFPEHYTDSKGVVVLNEIRSTYLQTLPVNSAMSFIGQKDFLFCASERCDHQFYSIHDTGIRLSEFNTPKMVYHTSASSLSSSKMEQILFQPIQNTYFKHISTLDNRGPLLDFNIRNLTGEILPQIYFIAGHGNNGTLRIIRKGLGIESLYSLDIPVSGTSIFTTPSKATFPLDSRIAISSSSGTSFYQIFNDDIRLIEQPFDTLSKTLVFEYSENLSSLVHISDKQIFVYPELTTNTTTPGDTPTTLSTLGLKAPLIWPPTSSFGSEVGDGQHTNLFSNIRIKSAAVSGSFLAIALRTGSIHIFTIENQTIKEIHSINNIDSIAVGDIDPNTSNLSNSDVLATSSLIKTLAFCSPLHHQNEPPFLAISTEPDSFSTTSNPFISIFSTNDFKCVSRTPTVLSSASNSQMSTQVATSLKFASFESIMNSLVVKQNYLVAGMTSGLLVIYSVDTDGILTKQFQEVLGASEVLLSRSTVYPELSKTNDISTLNLHPSNGTNIIFASSKSSHWHISSISGKIRITPLITPLDVTSISWIAFSWSEAGSPQITSVALMCRGSKVLSSSDSAGVGAGESKKAKNKKKKKTKKNIANKMHFCEIENSEMLVPWYSQIVSLERTPKKLLTFDGHKDVKLFIIENDCSPIVQISTNWSSSIRGLGFPDETNPSIAPITHFTYVFQPGESAISMTLVKFPNFPEPLLCVGTASQTDLSKPTDSPARTKWCKIHCFRIIKTKKAVKKTETKTSTKSETNPSVGQGTQGVGIKYSLVLHHSTLVPSTPNCMISFDGGLLVGVGPSLCLYSLGMKQLLLKCKHPKFPLHVQSLDSPDGCTRIVVGDVAHSLYFVHYSKPDKRFYIFCDDLVQRYITSIKCLDFNTAVGSDKFGSIFVLGVPNQLAAEFDIDPTGARLKSSSTRPWLNASQNKLECFSHWYVGDTVTTVTKASLSPFGGSGDLQPVLKHLTDIAININPQQVVHIEPLDVISKPWRQNVHGDQFFESADYDAPADGPNKLSTNLLNEATSKSQFLTSIFFTTIGGGLFSLTPIADGLGKKIPKKIEKLETLFEKRIVEKFVNVPQKGTLVGNNYRKFRSYYFPMKNVVDSDLLNT